MSVDMLSLIPRDISLIVYRILHDANTRELIEEFHHKIYICPYNDDITRINTREGNIINNRQYDYVRNEWIIERYDDTYKIRHYNFGALHKGYVLLNVRVPKKY